MKQLISLGLLLVSFFTLAQNNQFIYEYTFKLDSLNRNNSESEMMILETSEEGSKFYSYVKYVHDSTVTATFKKGHSTGQNHYDFSSLKNAKVESEVFKKYPEFSTRLKTEIGDTRVVLENNKKMNWKIVNEKSKILNYDVQKATTRFQGRDWIAWFASELPINDGPYRFFGLPGLILKLEDTRGDHIFTLVGTKKSATAFTIKKSPKDIVVNEKKFRKLWKEYKKDPAKEFRKDLQSDSNLNVSVTFNGKTYSNEEIAREIEKESIERLKKENNFIDLDLYQ